MNTRKWIDEEIIGATRPLTPSNRCSTWQNRAYSPAKAFPEVYGTHPTSDTLERL